MAEFFPDRIECLVEIALASTLGAAKQLALLGSGRIDEVVGGESHETHRNVEVVLLEQALGGGEELIRGVGRPRQDPLPRADAKIEALELDAKATRLESLLAQTVSHAVGRAQQVG